ncbi:hypothetical protein Y032_0530g3011 [Ancylostoma ceylanicum]|uniref:Uncharacterized protein n=1 Tax=Ancylostoma ceylanicum TaxID=53326 RepID=A0A016WRR6_9BILA|nr:hypothetical protein Y032_0530g3011 [Ancylostoma ceylanicum]
MSLFSTLRSLRFSFELPSCLSLLLVRRPFFPDFLCRICSIKLALLSEVNNLSSDPERKADLSASAKKVKLDVVKMRDCARLKDSRQKLDRRVITLPLKIRSPTSERQRQRKTRVYRIKVDDMDVRR